MKSQVSYSVLVLGILTIGWASLVTQAEEKSPQTKLPAKDQVTAPEFAHPEASALWQWLLRVLGESARQQRTTQPASDRDPFATTQTMQEAARRSGQEPVAHSEPPALPRMSLKGLANDGQQPPVALLEVAEQGAFIVRKGDQFSLQFQGALIAIQVQEITDNAVRVQVGTHGQTILVR